MKFVRPTFATAAAKKRNMFRLVPSCVALSAQVVGILEQEVPDLIEVPKALEHASTVGDHLNFHLVNPTEEENLAFQVVSGLLVFAFALFNKRMRLRYRGRRTCFTARAGWNWARVTEAYLSWSLTERHPSSLAK